MDNETDAPLAKLAVGEVDRDRIARFVDEVLGPLQDEDDDDKDEQPLAE